MRDCVGDDGGSTNVRMGRQQVFETKSCRNADFSNNNNNRVNSSGAQSRVHRVGVYLSLTTYLHLYIYMLLTYYLC